jgi:hypothetical protein
LVCASNIKGIGTSAKIYANDNLERWMVPAFQNSLIDQEGVDYLKDNPEYTTPPNDPGEVGWMRHTQGTSETSAAPQGGSRASSTTRSYWMMVRSGDITVKQFVCTSGNDDKDDTENLDLYYDFTTYLNISYGYQVPFGPRDTQPREGLDNRQVLAADKGPWYMPPPPSPNWNVGREGGPIDVEDSPKAWRAFNSANHGGSSNGEGQNSLYADGHASFNRIPACGIDNDNIYTLITDEWGTMQHFNLIHGQTPHESDTGGPPYPGQDAYGSGANRYASTDSLIYP